MDDEARQELGRELISQVVTDHSAGLLEGGSTGLTDGQRSDLTRALFDAMFRLGRFQPLVDREDVENIEITGNDDVLLQLVDGSFEEAAPVAESDADLVEFLQFLATRDPANEQAFTRSNYKLEMPLPGRARLAAIYWVVPRPRVTIRLQRIQRVDLSWLRRAGELDLVLERFLEATVRARRTIVVSGKGQGSGKTTLLRALCACIPRMESVATIEGDYELYLHDDPERHRRVIPMQARTGAGEMTAAGTRVGAAPTGLLLHDSLRHNVDRIIVGEVRGAEIVTLFEAMQAGNGSMSTVHADSARDVVERLAGLAARDATLSETFAYRQVAQTIDLIVYLDRRQRPDGSWHRYITEIIECTRGEQGNPVATSTIFGPDEKGRAVPMNPPTFLDELVRGGFDRSLLNYRDGLWDADDQAEGGAA
ncbi:CpaF family protein [Promicromonospora sp. NFX87]|uniref:CpaF family protein n=1 Tax=Promicromonospora sp. NFX87 TaxID=3402691 RepID=UPI003AFA3D19